MFEKEMNPNPKHKDLGEDREWELHWGGSEVTALLIEGIM